MTQTEFLIACNNHAVSPEIALENESIRAALATRNDLEIERILDEEF